ncbi:MAG: flagellar filament capping protein FliD [Candidatus Latescibacterota bacterium]|nr:flagellar filament capping protein FliD [Candidatus Latescibacterota bacterium]
MSQGVSFAGLGSGLDTDAIISQLIDIERRPVVLIQRRQVELEQERAAIGSINSSLLSFKDSVAKLESDDLFSIVNAQSDDSNRISVSATNKAAAGSFSVKVLELAQSRRLSSRSFNSLSDQLGLSGDFTVNGQGIELASDDSLLDIRNKINAADAGVSAQILTVASGDNRLILTADEVGEDGFSIQDASSTNTLQALGFTSAGTDIKNAFASGGRSGQFLASDQAVGELLGLTASPSGTVTVGDWEIQIDLATDSLDDIRDKITAAASTAVTATVTSSEEEGLTRYRLEIEGTTNFIDNGGVLENMAMVAGDGSIADEIVTGAESDVFVSTSTALASLLGLANAPNATVQIGGTDVEINLADDSLTDIQTKINTAAPVGVTATITSDSDDDGNTQFRLRIDGTDSFVDSGNVLEGIGILVGSNNAFESVAQVLTANSAQQENGVLVHATDNGAKTNELASATDVIGGLLGSTAAGTVTIGDKTVAIDLANDSLNDIRDAIIAAAPSGVTAVVNATGPSTFELEISGTTDFTDAGGVLQTLGVITAPATLEAGTRLVDILGAGVQVGDTITIGGTNHDGNQVAGSFTMTSENAKVENLLTTIEQTFGDDIEAAIDDQGRISIRDLQAGDSQLDLSLTANNEGGGSLDLGILARTTTGVDARSAELQAGQNAIFNINGIRLSRSANTVTDAVQGVTLNLLEAEADQLVSITIDKDDTSTLRGNIQSFVDEFNAVMDLIGEYSAFDPDTQRGGPLTGDSTLISIQSQLRSVVSAQVGGLADGFDALVLIGVSFDRNGRLNIDEDRLTTALNENLEDVRKLFVAQGTTNDDNVEFVATSSRTKAGNYEIEVTQGPTKGEALGSVEFSGQLVADQTLELLDKVSGKPASIALAAGADLDDIITAINAELASDLAEVRRASIANTTNGTQAIDADTVFADIFGAGAQNGDTIRINITTHGGNSLTDTFTIDDVETAAVGDLLTQIRSTLNGQVSVSVDAEGRISVTDNQVGNSDLTVTLIEENEGGGSLNFGSIEAETEGRFALGITASNTDGRLLLEHNGSGSRNGFSIEEDFAALGLTTGSFDGLDVQGTINGEDADGFGRILTGAIDAENVAGLSLRINQAADEISTEGENLGSVDLIYGVARRLSDSLGSITDRFEGTLTNREQAIGDTIDNLDKRVVDMERRIEQKRLNLVGRFATLEGTIANLQSQGNFLSSQLSGLTSR